jgi:hypothetical protein
VQFLVEQGTALGYSLFKLLVGLFELVHFRVQSYEKNERNAKEKSIFFSFPSAK